MRDNWDDKFNDASRKINWSCDMVLSHRKQFFSIGLNRNVEDKIIAHCLTCPKCKKEYEKYAKDLGYKNFNVTRYALSFATRNKDMEDSETIIFLNQLNDETDLRVLNNQWTEAAKDFNIEYLMNLKMFRDLMLEYKSPTKEDYSEFFKYITLKNAKYIDHLEQCLLKSNDKKNGKIKNIKTEKRIKNEKSK